MRIVPVIVMLALVGCGSSAQLVQESVLDEIAARRAQEERQRREVEELQNAASRELNKAYAQTEALMEELNAANQFEVPDPVVVVRTVPDGTLDANGEASLQSLVARSESQARWAKQKLEAVSEALEGEQEDNEARRTRVAELLSTINRLRDTHTALGEATDASLAERYGAAGVIATILSMIGLAAGRAWGLAKGRTS